MQKPENPVRDIFLSAVGAIQNGDLNAIGADMDAVTKWDDGRDVLVLEGQAPASAVASATGGLERLRGIRRMCGVRLTAFLDGSRVGLDMEVEGDSFPLGSCEIGSDEEILRTFGKIRGIFGKFLTAYGASVWPRPFAPVF